jgi:hypothetical protein
MSLLFQVSSAVLPFKYVGELFDAVLVTLTQVGPSSGHSNIDRGIHPNMNQLFFSGSLLVVE